MFPYSKYAKSLSKEIKVQVSLMNSVKHWKAINSEKKRKKHFHFPWNQHYTDTKITLLKQTNKQTTKRKITPEEHKCQNP